MNTPKERILAAARSLLSEAERIGGRFHVSGEEFETLAAARLTLAEVQRRALVLRDGSLGDSTRAELGRVLAADRDRREALELRGYLRALVDARAIPPATPVTGLLRRLDELLLPAEDTHPG